MEADFSYQVATLDEIFDLQYNNSESRQNRKPNFLRRWRSLGKIRELILRQISHMIVLLFPHVLEK